MNWLKEKIDSYYFKRTLNKLKVGLSPDEIEWLGDHSKHIIRITETMKYYIFNQTLNSLTVRDHQRKKDWYDCLTSIQNLCKTTDKKEAIDFRTMKPIKKDEDKKDT